MEVDATVGLVKRLPTSIQTSMAGNEPGTQGLRLLCWCCKQPTRMVHRQVLADVARRITRGSQCPVCVCSAVVSCGTRRSPCAVTVNKGIDHRRCQVWKVHITKAGEMGQRCGHESRDAAVLLRAIMRNDHTLFTFHERGRNCFHRTTVFRYHIIEFSRKNVCRNVGTVHTRARHKQGEAYSITNLIMLATR